MKRLAFCLLFSCIGCVPASVDPDEPKCTLTYNGSNAKEWYVDLCDRNENVQARAVFALQQLGDEGDYYFVKGMRTGDPYIQDACVSHWAGSRSASNLEPYKKDLLPYLKKTAGDTGPRGHSTINAKAAQKILKELGER